MPDPDRAETFAAAREAMIAQQLRRRGIQDERVLAAFARVPRHEFVPAAVRAEAYADKPLEIGAEQTISQPYMHASMIEAARIAPHAVVLEVGTGSGYQTAILAELAAEVFSIERIPSFATNAQRLLAHLQYANVVVRVGDGSAGMTEGAPYDAIIVSAAAPRAPAPLLEQLADGGRLLVPLAAGGDQWLHRFCKRGSEMVDERLYPVRFVPLVGRYGAPADS